MTGNSTTYTPFPTRRKWLGASVFSVASFIAIIGCGVTISVATRSSKDASFPLALVYSLGLLPLGVLWFSLLQYRTAGTRLVIGAGRLQLEGARTLDVSVDRVASVTETLSSLTAGVVITVQIEAGTTLRFRSQHWPVSEILADLQALLREQVARDLLDSLRADNPLVLRNQVTHREIAKIITTALIALAIWSMTLLVAALPLEARFYLLFPAVVVAAEAALRRVTSLMNTRSIEVDNQGFSVRFFRKRQPLRGQWRESASCDALRHVDTRGIPNGFAIPRLSALLASGAR
ncbi:MAG: hypothetical protein AAF581_21425 [Planctomycetota bacterium]